MVISIIIAVTVMALVVWALQQELKRDLMMFQQNSYRPERYRRWLSDSKDTTSMWRLAALIIFFIGLSKLSSDWASLFLMAIFAISCAVTLVRRKYKHSLVWTARARRIYAVACLLSIAVTVVFAWLVWPKTDTFVVFTRCAIAFMGCFCASHVIIILANFLLKPVEHAITMRYYRDAQRILASMPDLKIIGITGSYGKTSTKHYLHRILSEQFDTLMTPGSFNTTLGVVRTVREYLKPYNEVFIVEMGAKNLGDIKEICDLVHPSMGIITAVGPQHLESFKSIENVQRTKFELADALPSDGTIIVNNDFPMIANRPVENCHCLRYSIKGGDTPWRAVDIEYSSHGTKFTVIGPDGYRLQLETQLMGEANISDLLAAVVCAKALDVPDTKIIAAVASIEPVEHRLSVKRTAGGITILDDAFNSNPVGSRMALEVLGSMKGGKRIVITPGMIELGAEQYELNFELGKTIATNVDVAIIVGQYNREALTSGVRDSGTFPADSLIIVDSFAEAQQRLAQIAAKGDTILYENDLPDTFK